MKRRTILTAQVLVLLLAAMLLSACGKNEVQPSASVSQAFDTNGTENTPPPEAIESPEEPGLALPYDMANGKLRVRSLFQSSIMNPDCGGEYAEDIATLEIENISGEFLREAHITAVLPDGREIPFAVTNIPAGRTVWAFATDNASIEVQPVCEEILCEAEFAAEAPLMSDVIEISVDEIEVTLTNLSGEDITGLTIGCHCLFDEIYFGGLTYTYPADTIPAGGNVSIIADDCYLGSAEVVSMQ